MVYIFFKFLVLCNDIKNVLRRKPVPNKAKNSEVLVENLLTQTHFLVLNIKKIA